MRRSRVQVTPPAPKQKGYPRVPFLFLGIVLCVTWKGVKKTVLWTVFSPLSWWTFSPTTRHNKRGVSFIIYETEPPAPKQKECLRVLFLFFYNNWRDLKGRFLIRNSQFAIRNCFCSKNKKVRSRNHAHKTHSSVVAKQILFLSKKYAKSEPAFLTKKTHTFRQNIKNLLATSLYHIKLNFAIENVKYFHKMSVVVFFL